MKGEIRVEKGDFRGDLFFFEGFEPCLGISHPTHPHLGKVSQKTVFIHLPLFLVDANKKSVFIRPWYALLIVPVEV